MGLSRPQQSGDWRDGGLGGCHVIGKGQFPPATGGCHETRSDGMVLMASGSQHGAGEAEKTAPVASRTKRHVMPAGSSPWPPCPLGVSCTVFAIECTLWPGLLGSNVDPSTGSEEDRCHVLGHHDVGLLVSSEAGNQREVVGVECSSRVREQPFPQGSWQTQWMTSLDHGSEVTTQMPVAPENEGILLAGGCLFSPRTSPPTVEAQNSRVTMSVALGTKSRSKSWFCHFPMVNL